jgi:hypothetical protein
MLAEAWTGALAPGAKNPTSYSAACESGEA